MEPIKCLVNQPLKLQYFHSRHLEQVTAVPLGRFLSNDSVKVHFNDGTSTIMSKRCLTVGWELGGSSLHEDIQQL